MPLDTQRLSRLRKVKGMKQGELARLAGVTQTHISECEGGKEPSVAFLEKLADSLDCTTDFLLGRSSPEADLDEEAFRAAVSGMAFDAFARRINVGSEQKDRCRKVLRHSAAPLTADAWVILSEQIDLAIGGPSNGALQLLRGGG